MSLATVCASAWVRAGNGVPVPGVWAAATEATAIEMVEFAREALRMVVEAHEWQALIRTHSVALTSALEQTVALPADFGRLVPDTVWITQQAWPVRGPLSEAEYEALRQPPQAAGWPVFRISNRAVQLLASPPTGGTLTLRYVTGQPVANGLLRRATWAADTDEALIDERLVVLALVALWRDSKGLGPANAASIFSRALSLSKAQDRPVGVLGMDGRGRRGRDDLTVILA